MHISKCTYVHTYHTYTPPPPDTHVHPRSYVHQLLITFSLNITMHEPKSYTSTCTMSNN